MKTPAILLRSVLLMLLCGVSPLRVAAADDPVAAALLGKLKAARADLEYSMPRQSAMPGLYEVSVKRARRCTSVLTVDFSWRAISSR